MRVNMRITMNDLNQDVLAHSKLPDLVLDKLMDWIMSGKLSMGDKLNTEELASQLGVSRMPIREALSNLEKKGLAESIPYAGTRLVTLTKEDVRQIYIARTALEPVAARYACEKITDEEIKHIREIQEEYKCIVRQKELDAIDVYQQNRLYHFSIYKASQLDRVCTMIESLWDNLSFFKLIYGQKLLDSGDSRESMIEEHESYLNALEKRDSDLISHLLECNLKKRSENIPYYSDAYFHENT
ncbi:GntR family transcriptional regulator [Roseburia hominis]